MKKKIIFFILGISCLIIILIGVKLTCFRENLQIEYKNVIMDYERKNIEYPQIYNMNDESRQQEVNDSIYNLVLSFVEEYDIEQDISYEITKLDAKAVSIIFTIESIGSSLSDKLFVDYKAVNIDLETGELIGLNDLVDVEQVYSLFLDGKYEMIQGVNDVAELDAQLLLDMYSEEPLHLYDFYVTEEGVVIIIMISQGRYYAFFEIKDLN